MKLAVQKNSGLDLNIRDVDGIAVPLGVDPDTTITKYTNYDDYYGSELWVFVGAFNKPGESYGFTDEAFKKLVYYQGAAEKPLKIISYEKPNDDLYYQTPPTYNVDLGMTGAAYLLDVRGVSFMVNGVLWVIGEDGIFRAFPLDKPSDRPADDKISLDEGWYFYEGSPEPITEIATDFTGRVVDLYGSPFEGIVYAAISGKDESYIVPFNPSTGQVYTETTAATVASPGEVVYPSTQPTTVKVNEQIMHVVSDGLTTLVVSTDGTNYYIRSLRGTTFLWEYSTASPLGKPALAGSFTTGYYVYVQEGSGTASVTVLNASTGSKVTSIALTGTNVLPSWGIGLDSGEAIMFNPNQVFMVNSSGSILWSVALTSTTTTSPAPLSIPYDGTYIYLNVLGNLTKIDVSTGSTTTLASGLGTGGVQANYLMGKYLIMTFAGTLKVFDTTTWSQLKSIPYVYPYMPFDVSALPYTQTAPYAQMRVGHGLVFAFDENGNVVVVG